MGTVIQDTQQPNYDRQPRWDRFERADLFEHYRELRAQGMSQRQTVTQDETFTGGLCLVTMDPESDFIILEQLAQPRDPAGWHACMAPALAPLNGQVIQSTSAEAPGLLAYVEPSLAAHHAPDVFPVQHALVNAVSGPMATQERATHQALSAARDQREPGQAHQQCAGDEPDKRGPAPTSTREPGASRAGTRSGPPCA